MPYLGVRPADITSATEAEIAGDLTVNTNNLKVDATTGRVGVGTASPQNLAHFKGTSSGENILHLDNSAGSGHGDTNNNVRVVSGNNGYWANLVIAGQQLEFKVQGGTSMLRVDSDGVKFNGDTAAANALDDYEEGTWTPVLTPASSGSITISSSTAKYTKIGNLVFINVFITIGSVSSPNGRLGLSGSPYSATGQPYAAVCHVNGFSSFSGKAGALVEASGTFNIDRYVNGGLAADLANNAGAGDNIFLTATYPVS